MIAKLRGERFQEYLFTSKDKIWESKKLSKVLRTQASLSGIEGLSISSWRQIAVGIARKHFMRGGFRMDFDDAAEEEGLGFKGLDESKIWHHLAAHSSKAANLHYGRTIDLGKG